MVDQVSYRSIRDQLVSITVDIEDKSKVCHLLERNIEKERQQLASADASVREEYERILESEMQAHKQTSGQRTTQTQDLMQEKKDLINSCNDLVTAVKEQEHDLSAEVRAVYKDAEVQIESEKKVFRAGYEDRLQKFLTAKAAEYKDSAIKALHPNITRLQMQHEQELSDVERALQAQERTIRETLTTQLQARLEEERVAAKEELKLSLRAVQEKATVEAESARREQRKQLQRQADETERELEQHRQFLREKAQRNKDRAHAELKQTQEGSQQRMEELQQRHAKHLQNLQREHDQELQSLRRQADASRRAQHSELHRQLQSGSTRGGAGRAGEFNDSDEDDTGGGGRSTGRSKGSVSSSGRGPFSPKRSPGRKSSAGSLRLDSLLEYSEFSAGADDHGSVSTGLAMDAIDQDPEGAAEEELEIAACVRTAQAERDRQIQSEIRALESETLRLERAWRAKAEMEEKQALAAVAKEEEYTALRRGRQGGAGGAGSPQRRNAPGMQSDDIAELVVEREKLLAQVQALQSRVDRAAAEEAEASREVNVYKEGIAAHRSRIQDKQEQHRLHLREIQLESGPRLRELRERYESLCDQVRENAERCRAQLSAVEKEHAAELAKLDAQVKGEVARREEDIERLREAAEAETAKIARLERLIKQYSGERGEASTGGGDGAQSGDTYSRRGASGVVRGGRSTATARSGASTSAGGSSARGVTAPIAGSTASVASGSSSRATGASSQRLSSLQRLKPSVPTQATTSATATRPSTGTTTQAAGKSGALAGSSISPRGSAEVRRSTSSSGARSSANAVRGSRQALHATHTAASAARTGVTSPRYAAQEGKSDSGDEFDAAPQRGVRGSAALHRTAPVASTSASAQRHSLALSDEEGFEDGAVAGARAGYGDSADSGSDTGEEPQPVPAWMMRRRKLMHEVIKRAVLHPGGKGLFLAQQFKHRTDHLQQFMSDLEASAAMPPIDPSIEKFPYCIVWTPIPCITWLLPFIGHTGIGDSNGVIHDFAGPYHIGIGSLAFGRATRYIQLSPESCSAQEWDTGVKEGCEIYKGRNHNLLLDNCHSHVAKCLNIMAYNRHSSYDMVKIGVWVFFYGKFVSPWAFVKTYLPFTVIVFVIALLSGAFA